jgi:hypothetical protein
MEQPHTLYVHMMHACISIHARVATQMNGSPMRARRTHAPACCVRVCVCDWARMHPRRHLRARSVGVDRGWFGSQAFAFASAFNANIGAWNTARVTTLSQVCAAFPARAARHRRRDALGRVFDAARAVVRGGTADARARVGADVWACACAGVHLCVGKAARSKRVTCMYVCM